MPLTINCPSCNGTVIIPVDMEKQKAALEALPSVTAIADERDAIAVKLATATAVNADLQAEVDHHREVNAAAAAAEAQAKADAVAAAVQESSEVAPPGHVTDVDVVGEAGSVVEVKHDAPPGRMTGPTFDLP